MFLGELTEPQSKMFQALAKRMVLADWRLEDHEKVAIARVEEELGHPLAVETVDLMSNENLHVLDTERARRIVFYELCVLAHQDLKIDRSERHVFNDLAEEMKIPADILTKLEAMSVDGYALISVGADDTHHKETVNAVLNA